MIGTLEPAGLWVEPGTFWSLVDGALRLHPEAFRAVERLGGYGVALPIVLVAGLSQAIGQSVVLFVNRVRPGRFVLSLAISSLLFAVTYGLFTISVLAVVHVLFGGELSFTSAARVVGLGFAPRMLAFLAFLPFFGVFIDVLLSLWTLLTVLTGIALVEGIAPWQALAATLLGGLLLLAVQHTIGRPVASLTLWLRERVAGRRLVTEPRGVERLIEAGPDAPEAMVAAVIAEVVAAPAPDAGAEPGAAGHAPAPPPVRGLGRKGAPS